MTNRSRLVALGVLLPLLATAAKDDARHSQDHPLVDRYPDSYITNYTYTEFDQYELPTGPTAT